MRRGEPATTERGRHANLQAGYIRSFTLGDDGTWLIVTTVVSDPTYLTQEFVISSPFRKETDLTRWTPRRCENPAPQVPAQARERQ
jgi:hypothetical protein